MRAAAIDCGTNSLRLLIADVEDGQVRDVVRTMRVVRLGEGVDVTGRLAPEALERAWAGVQDYADQIKAAGVQAVRMVATSASRDAENADEFVAGVSSSTIMNETKMKQPKQKPWSATPSSTVGSESVKAKSAMRAA